MEFYLVNRVSEELWIEVFNIVLEAVTKTIPKKKWKTAMWLSEEALQILRKKEVKVKGDTERYILLNAEFQRRARRDKMAFCNEQNK